MSQEWYLKHEIRDALFTFLQCNVFDAIYHCGFMGKSEPRDLKEPGFDPRQREICSGLGNH